MIDKTIEELKQIKQTLEELQRKFAELMRENEFLKETNAVLSKELTKNSIMQQDHIETFCGIPIREIPLLKEVVAIYEKAFKLACEELVSCKKEFMKNYNFTAENEMDAFLDLANRS